MLYTNSSEIDSFEIFALFCKEYGHCWTQDIYILMNSWYGLFMHTNEIMILVLKTF